MDVSGYLLEPLREDAEFILYRARSTQPELASKLLLTHSSSHPSAEVFEKIDHEYSLKDDLDTTWAIRPLEISSFNDKRVLVLEDPGGTPLNRVIEGPMGMQQFLRLAVRISQAVGQLHRRRLIHKDLKPANVFVSGDAGQVWLTGFGIASRLGRERQSPEAPEFISGTLAYMAPEQTGRMNRSIDSRSDLYAVGITLYELLTGCLPFTASDPMEWVYSHIARQPVPPHERLENVPLTVSAILMKLLAKTPEERYQTAYGARSDLQRCLDQWQTAAAITQFRLGENDVPDRLMIPEKLYGRTSEIDILLTAFERVASGSRPELVLVSGYSGIGKSSVVNELHKVLVPRRGLFASGKFDQYKRDIPYATLAQAFQSLIRPLLSKSEGELSKWREVLQLAVGPNGRLIVDLVPELKLIIGDPPQVPELPLQQAQHRFQLVFRRFVSAFATHEHPLALFFDDLQWLDAATLDVVEDLLTQSDVGHLMLIGAYRDNEVDASHPLMRKLASIRSAGAIVKEIGLEALKGEDLAQLVVDSFHCEPQRATPLAALIQQKTAGNPFFAIQFISALVEEHLVNFDYGQGRWVWDLGSIQAKGYTENVVDLMVGKLNRLAPETQKALQLLACVGNSADFALLEMVNRGSEEGMHHRLWQGVQAGVIVRAEHSYKFLHDRVQEAAYSLIPEASRAEAHLGIGRLLLAHTHPQKLEENIFEIVNQLNRGPNLIESSEERRHLAELNVIAGRRAKVSTAYNSALSYFRAARALLTEQSWNENYELIFTIEHETAACELFSAQIKDAEKRLSMLVQQARSEHDLAIVTRLRAMLYTTLDRSDRAVEVCLEFLRRIGTDWSPHPTANEVQREYDRIWSQLQNRQVEDLLDLPLMTNGEALDALDVLAEAVTPALFCDERLSSLVICRMVNLSLEHGNSDASCFAYVWFAIIAGPRFANYEAAFRFGQLGYDLVERRGLKRFQARTYMSFGDIVLPWRRHVRAGRDLIRRAFHAANEIGDLTFAGYCCDHLVKNMLAAGDPLADVQREAEYGLEFAEKVRFGLVVDHIKAQLGLVRTLRGLVPKFGSFDDGQFDEQQFERYLASNPALAELECWYWVRKLQGRFFAGDYLSAIDASLNAQRQLWTSPSQFEVAELHFYGALSQAASWDSAPLDRRQEHFDALAVHLRQLETWAEHCPENFENRAALAKAEMERIEGHDLNAMRLYELAIRSAHTNGFDHNEAIAHELAARFYAIRGFDRIADSYLREARNGYVRWGADGKVRQLENKFLHLGQEEPRFSGGTIGAAVDHLDFKTFLKVSQAVSSEIVLEKLIDTLLRTAVEQAGAQRGLLILPRSADLLIEAEATMVGSSVQIGFGGRQVSSAEVPEQIVQYAARTHEPVILDDASHPSSFSGDEYIRERQPRSILCLPLVKQRKLIALLYLENSLAVGAFTKRRMAVLEVLVSAAAISLENSRLYRDLQEREGKIRRLVDANIVGIFIWDFEGRILEANDSFLRIVGYEREHLAADHLQWTELTPREWRDRDHQALADLRSVGSTQPYEKEFLRKDGSRVPVLIGGALFEAGRNDGVSFVLDLTEQKRADQALRRSESYLAQSQRLAHIGSWAWEIPSRNAIYISEEWFRIHGFDPKGGMPGWEQRLQRVHPEDRARFQATIDGAIAAKSNFDVEFRILSPDSLGKFIHSVGRPILDSSGELVQFVGVSMDVTDTKQAQEAFRLVVVGTAATTGSDFFQSLVQHMAQALRTRYAFVTTCDDQKHARTLAFWKGDGFGENFEFNIADTPCEKVLHGEICHYREGLQGRFPLDKVLADWQAESYLGLPMLDRSNRVIGHIAILDDKPMEADVHTIDLLKIFASRAAAELKRQKAEEELQAALQERERLRRAQADLARINRVSTMGELTASLAHEIKQPIGAAVTNAEACVRLLDRDEPDLPEAREAALEMVRDARRAADIIDRVRSLYQKGSSELDTVDVNEIIREMVVMLQNEANRHSVTIHADLATGLPKTMADRVQLQQALMNLMLNSIEAMQDTSGELSIKSQLLDDGQLLISVADTGVGLPADVSNIFDAFFTTKSRGTGLGLAITRSIVNSHGGRIWATANPGRGATFHFTLPSTVAVAA